MSIYLILLLLVIIIGTGYAGICFLFSGLILYSHRQPLVKTPKEYGLDYSDIEFKSTDGLTLKGWFIPHPSNKVMIMTHPFPFNRHGFITKNQGFLTRFSPDVDLLKTAQALHQAGYAVLMFDFRNHGESEKGMTGIGLHEYKDVIGAVEYVKNHVKSSMIGFVSFCMGANSTIVAMGKAPEQLQDVACLVAVQPVSASVFVRSYVKKTFTPLGLVLIPLVDRMCQWRGGYSLKEMSPLQYCKGITAPTMYIQAKTDPWTVLSDIQGFFNVTPQPKEFWMLEEEMRRFDAYNYVGEHPEKMISFIDTYMK